MSGDALDDLLDADISTNNVFRDVDTNMDVSLRRKMSPGADGAENGLGLGIDEEVKISKKRKPVAKLDENRLLSQAGIPKLRRIAKERLRFKGKGHEYSDVARLLNIYQLWLDDLYPRAKFADGLSIIEKLGHTKRIQTMRREWINDGKPRDTSVEIFKANMSTSTSEQKTPKSKFSLTVLNSEKPSMDSQFNDNIEDLYSATPPKKSQERTDLLGTSDTDDSLFLSIDEKDNPTVEEPTVEEDDLDMLLAEDCQQTTVKTDHSNSSLAWKAVDESIDDDYDNDMEAMAEMNNDW